MYTESRLPLLIDFIFLNSVSYIIPLQEDEQLPADDSDADCDDLPENVLARYTQSQDHLDQTGTAVPNAALLQSSIVIPRTKATPATNRSPLSKTAKPQNADEEDAEDDNDDDNDESRKSRDLEALSNLRRQTASDRRDNFYECVPFVAVGDAQDVSQPNCTNFQKKIQLNHNRFFCVQKPAAGQTCATKGSPTEDTVEIPISSATIALENLNISDDKTVPTSIEKPATPTTTTNTNQSATVPPALTTPTIIHATPKQQQLT